MIFLNDNSEASCPRLCATRKLARLLNLMDNRIGVTAAACPRWDVMGTLKLSTSSAACLDSQINIIWINKVCLNYSSMISSY